MKIRTDIPSKPIEIHQNPSKPIKTHRNPSKSIKTHQNPSKSIETHRNPSKPVNRHKQKSFYTVLAVECRMGGADSQGSPHSWSARRLVTSQHGFLLVFYFFAGHFSAIQTSKTAFCIVPSKLLTSHLSIEPCEGQIGWEMKKLFVPKSV